MRRTLLTPVLAAAMFFALACTDYPGPRPPLDALQWPVGVAVHPDGGVIYVVSTNFDQRYRNDSGGTVIALDAETLRPIPDSGVYIGSFGAEIAFAPREDGTGRLFVAVRGDDSVVQLDVSADGREIFCPEGGAFGTLGGQEGLACRVQELGQDPFAVALVDAPPVWSVDETGAPLEQTQGWPDGLLMVGSLGNRISVLSTQDANASSAEEALVSQLNGGVNSLTYFPPTGQLITTGRFTSNVRLVDWFLDASGAPAEVVVTRVASLPTTLDRSEMRDAVLSNDSRTLWVTATRPDTVFLLDMRIDDTGEPRMQPDPVLPKFDLDGGPADVVLVQEGSREMLYVALADAGELVAVDGRTGRVDARIPIGAQANGLAYDAERQALYVSAFADDLVARVDLAPGSPTFRQVVARSAP